MLSPLEQPDHEAASPQQVSPSKCHTADFSTLLTAASSVASPSHSRHAPQRGSSSGSSQARRRPRIATAHAQDKHAVFFAPLPRTCPPQIPAPARATTAGTQSEKKPTDATGTPAKKPARKRKTPSAGSAQRHVAPAVLASASPHAPVPLAPAPSLTPSPAPAPPVKVMVGKLPLPPLPRRVGTAAPAALTLPLPPWAWKKIAEEAQQQFKAACNRKENNGSTSVADSTAAARAAGVAKKCSGLPPTPPELVIKLQELQRQQIQVMQALQGNAFAKVFPKSFTNPTVETSTTSAALNSTEASTSAARRRPSIINTVVPTEGAVQKAQEDSSPGLMPRPAAPHESETPRGVDAGPAVVPMSPGVRNTVTVRNK